jgi:polyferredoxin
LNFKGVFGAWSIFSFVFLFANNASSIVCIASNFIFTQLEMVFFSLLCPQGVNSTNFARVQEIPDQISLGSRDFHI